MITQQGRSDVYLNGQQAGQELDKLASKAEKLKKEMVEMRKANDKAGFDQKQKELKAVNKEMTNLQKQAFDVNKVLKNLKSTSLNDLYKAQRELNREMKKLPQNSKEYKQMEKDAGKLASQINKVKTNTKGIQSPLSKVKSLLVGIGAVAALKSLIQNMSKVRMEFEKYTAMLEVALGSQDLAKKSMRELANFAASTPFQLQQLTGAYVKLVNQGFKPSRAEMTKLGDLTAAMGKDFDQLTEAIIDAQTGEFERLKEFGIRASKEGDKVTFTFREQKTQVDFTADSIRQYILGLGEVEGISGSMAKVSETLGGRVSNLSDAWDNLMNSMGSKSSGIMVSLINWLIDFTNGLAQAAKGIKQIKQEVLDENVGNQLELEVLQTEKLAEEYIKIYGDKDKALERARFRTEENIKASILSTLEKVENATSAGAKENYQNQVYTLQQLLKAYQDHYVEVELLEKKRADAYRAQQASEAEKRKKADDKKKKEQVKEAEDTQKEIYDAEMAVLHQKFIDQSITEEEYENEILSLKVANLMAEIEIRKQFNLDYADLEEELFAMRVAYIQKTQAENEKRDAKEKADADKKAREDQQRREKEFRDAERLLQRQYDSATNFAADITASMVDSWNDRKQSEADYNQAVADLEAEYKAGKIEKEEYEEQLADINAERKKQEIAEEKGRGKQLLIIMLDYLKKYAAAKIAEITIGSLASAESIATFGIAGVAKAAVLTALVEGAIGLMQAKLSQNYAGRYPVTGAQDNRTYFAENAGIAKTGIYTSPSIVAEHGSELIVDSPTLSNISMNRPDILRDIQSLRIPQYASGRDPVQTSTSTSQSQSVSMERTNALLSQLISLLKSGNIKSVYDDYEVRRIRDRMSTINNIESDISK